MSTQHNKLMKCLFAFFTTYLMMSLFFVLSLQANNIQKKQIKHEERMKWWTEARFGMFIHWGIYAIPSKGVWYKSRDQVTDEEYQKYFELFNPDLFNPKEWARTAKEAGMKYFVITTKHHDGFCLWDSKFTDYKITNTPYVKDLIKPMVKAFRDEGLRVGFYYSLLDWHHRDFTVDRRHPMRDNVEFREKAKNRDLKKYVEYMHNQVRELLTEFGPIDCLFMDYSYPGGKEGKGRNEWQSEKLLKIIRELQPNVILNDRLDLLDVAGGWDYRTPEQFKPRDWIKIDGKRVPWETCQTFSGHWGYDRDEATWKSTRQLLVLLIETVSQGGNLLLNVGPTARGTFDNRAMNRLKGIGEWMKLNSPSIYGCTQAPEQFKAPENCIMTYNPSKNRLYIHVLDWPMGKLYLEGFAGKVKFAQLLHDASEIRFVPPRRSSVVIEEKVSEDTLILGLPIQKPDVTVPVIELFLN